MIIWQLVHSQTNATIQLSVIRIDEGSFATDLGEELNSRLFRSRH